LSFAGNGVITDDVFGAFFSVAFIIVSIMVTVSSWSYMRKKSNHAAYYSLILLSII
jgi:NADH-quinone oxidoreductase subunit N